MLCVVAAAVFPPSSVWESERGIGSSQNKNSPFFSFVRFVFLSSLRENGAFMHDGRRKEGERERGNAKRRVKGVEERKKGGAFAAT